MKVTIWNAAPPGVSFGQNAVDRWVGQEVPITNDGELVSMARVLRVTPTDDPPGIEMELEVEGPIGWRIELP